MAESAPSAIHRQSWFSYFELGTVIVAGGLWYNWPGLGWVPVILPLIPWAIRALEGGPLFYRTPLDVYFLLFLLTAGMGVWAAYSPSAAWAKFWLIVDGVFLYYALAGQPHRSRWWIAGGLGAFSAAIAVYFFLTHDWRVDPANIGAINRLGLAWMRIRPTIPTHILHSNVAAGIMAMLAPFLAALAAYGRQVRDARIGLAAWSGIALVGMALLMSTSRGAWIGLVLGAGIWVLWVLIERYNRKSGVPTFSLFLIVSGIMLAIGLVILVLFPKPLIVIYNSLPGPNNAGSRLDLVNASIALIGDFPFTGGGLDAFAGLYSQYILISPSNVLPHGHNIYLDVTLEQGLLGGMTLLLIFGHTIWILLSEIGERDRKRSTTTYVLWAALVGQMVLLVHGFADDILYGSRAPLLLWIFPGVAAGIQRVSSGAPARVRRVSSSSRPPLLAFLIGVVLLAFYFFLFRKPLLATWNANLGAVEMAREQLAFFPTDEWDDGRKRDDLRPAAARFEQALAYNPNNVTANYRLGEISMLFREFPRAVQYLEIARRNAPSHKGIQKLLGYNYVWVDRFTDAGQLLYNVSEASYEMNIYVNWWRVQGRNDLSKKAAIMVDNLGIISNK